MKLYLTAFLIACKHSSRRLLCLLCVISVCAVLLAGLFSASSPQSQEGLQQKAYVAIYNQDKNPLTEQVIRSMTTIDAMTSMVELVYVPDPVMDKEKYTAILTIPEGFLNSVLTGENLTPVVELNISTPLAAVFVRQMLQVGTGALTSAQQGVYAAQESMGYGEGLAPQTYQGMVNEINMRLIFAFLDRTNLESRELAATGVMSVPQYYAAAFAGLLLICYSFLYYPAVENLRLFAKQSRRRFPLFAAAFSHCFVLHFLLSILICTGASFLGNGGVHLLPALPMAFLSTAFAMAAALLFPDRQACAGGCILLALGMGLCSGAFLPLALMPAAFAKISVFFPSWQIQALASQAFGIVSQTPLWQPLLMSAVLAGLSWGLWKLREQKGGPC